MSDFLECKQALWNAIDEARAVEALDRTAAARILYEPVFRLAELVTKRRCKELSSAADVDHIQSVVTQAVWEAIARVQWSMDTRQVFQFFLQRATHAVADAAREADPLPRRARTYRKRLMLAVEQGAVHGDDAAIRRLAQDMFPQMRAETLELVVRGGSRAVDIGRVDETGALPALDDPADEVAARAQADAIHVAMCDQPDPAFRAWAAGVLAGDTDACRVPRIHAAGVRTARRALAAWA